MKKIVTLLVFAFAGQVSFAALNAYFSYATFDRPGKQSYVETYLNIIGNSVKGAKNEHNKFQGTIEVQWVYKQGEKIVHFDKYNLHSPEVDSLGQVLPSFIDQQRVALDSGEYTVELKIADKNSTDQAFTATQNISVHYSPLRVSISDIEFLESFTPSVAPGVYTKSGFDMIPYIQAFYPREISSLKFYAEIYNTKAILKQDYMVRYFISNNENRQLINELAGIRKFAPADVNVLLAEIPIGKVTSGNYNLTVEVRDRQNKLIAYKQSFFQRINPLEKPMIIEQYATVDINNSFISQEDNADTLKEYIACLAPISANLETQIAENQIALGDVQSMKQYIYHFWSQRNAEHPGDAWAAYKQEVSKTNVSFGTMNKRGYETDRGRVYLQYGPPNSITGDDMDPNSYPYEIWHYYKLADQSNRKFVFYNPIGSARDFKLLHSDAHGEITDDNWELKLHSRSQQYFDQDQQNAYDTYGSKTKENFKNPK